jgi:hypothetical protein
MTKNLVGIHVKSKIPSYIDSNQEIMLSECRHGQICPLGISIWLPCGEWIEAGKTRGRKIFWGSICMIPEKSNAPSAMLLSAPFCSQGSSQAKEAMEVGQEGQNQNVWIRAVWMATDSLQNWKLMLSRREPAFCSFKCWSYKDKTS